MANNKQKFWVRFICIALAAIMVGGVAYLALSLILSGLSQNASASFMQIL